ncbi:hypothetical protein V7O66_12715 [Methanolobus sp. ZRKC3]|uniref:hypothetical protein n=1 Tax=Methanolobus sp. ZRKC3 TaxID=3125786 RepID=UPI003248FFDD
MSEWSILPADPLAGDVLTIQGKAEPDKSIDIVVSFKVEVPVVEGMYEYKFDEIQIPKGRNSFEVRSQQVKDLNFIVKMFVDFKRSFDAKDGIAEFAENNVPHGKYDIIINGFAKEGESEVDIDFTAKEAIMSDNQGEFYHNYETNALPAGKFVVRIGNVEKEINLRQVT